MAIAVRILVALAAVVGLPLLGLMAASEAGEVVLLHTTDAGGADHTTRLWVVDLDGAQWLRAGHTGAAWFQQLGERPDVLLDRADELDHYRAVAVPEARERVDAEMAAKYGLADRVIALIRGSESVPIRLDPAPPPAPPTPEPAPAAPAAPSPA